MTNAQKRIIETLNRELARINKQAEKANAILDEIINAPLEIIKVRQAAATILSDPDYSFSKKEQEIKSLADREKRAINLGKKDYLKASEKQAEALSIRDSLAREIDLLKYRYGQNRHG